MTSSLENLSGAGKPLSAEPADAAEIASLIRSGKARLADAQVVSLSLESRFDLAYNAAHALCLAALRRHGYRTRHRYIVFQVLPHTLGLGPEVWRVLDKAHNTRNLAEYEGHVDVEERLVKDVITACEAVVVAWTRSQGLSECPFPNNVPSRSPHGGSRDISTRITPLRSWYALASRAIWKTPTDIKAAYGKASFIGNNRVVFNIKGNDYRLVVMVRYDKGLMYVRFVGTHRQYDKIDVETI